MAGDRDRTQKWAAALSSWRVSSECVGMTSGVYLSKSNTLLSRSYGVGPSSEWSFALSQIYSQTLVSVKRPFLKYNGPPS